MAEMKEVDHQSQIRLSVLKQQGYGLKLSNQFTVGVPDLFICLAPFVPCVAEVKDLGECGPDFKRKLNVTPKQYDTLSKIDGAYRGYVPKDPSIAFLLVTLFWEGASDRGRILVPLPKETEYLSSAMLVGGQYFGKRMAGSNGEPPSYDMRTILHHAGVPALW